MAYQIGTDEAGYGPNLGPLVICGTRWKTPCENVELYELLANSIAPQPCGDDRIVVCDSKLLYKSSGSIAALEQSVLGVLFGLFDQVPRDISELENMLEFDGDFSPRKLFADCKSELQLPLSASISDINRVGSSFRGDCSRLSIALEQVVCTAIFPRRFNEFIVHHGNKAELLSTQTMELVRQLIPSRAANLEIVCDKHGGRSKYLGLVNQFLTHSFVTVDCEQQQLSRYHWNESGRRVRLDFKMGGESFLPVAISSMIAKYIRELTMKVWNQFWASKLPGIKPTKGYPVDARRFRKEILAVQRELKIEDELIWRIR